MTNEQKANLIKMFAVRAELAGKVFSTAALVQMVEDICDLNYTQIEKTVMAWGRTERGFPFPADIRNKLMPVMNHEDDGQEIANLIMKSISQDGYTNSERAKNKIGELGWEVVQRMGGWQHLCEVITNDNESTFRAQIRDFAETVSKKAKRGELNTTPSLPQPENIIQSLVAKTFKSIE